MRQKNLHSPVEHQKIKNDHGVSAIFSQEGSSLFDQQANNTNISNMNMERVGTGLPGAHKQSLSSGRNPMSTSSKVFVS